MYNNVHRLSLIYTQNSFEVHNKTTKKIPKYENLKQY